MLVEFDKLKRVMLPPDCDDIPMLTCLPGLPRASTGNSFQIDCNYGRTRQYTLQNSAKLGLVKSS